ncbi:MAG: HD domain-containing protein [Magnetococcales bacterium]|nr:HD domain-containing protein [Magnetococcales bacterium]
MKRYAIHDPSLLEQGVLAEDVFHPGTGAIILKKGLRLTAKTIARLESFGVATVAVGGPEGDGEPSDADAAVQQMQQTWHVTDPDLPFMLLAQSVHDPATGALLFAEGCLLTPKIIAQLRHTGVTTVEAVPFSGDLIPETIRMVNKYMRTLEEIVRVHNRSAKDLSALYQEMAQVKELQGMMRERNGVVQHCFSGLSVECLSRLGDYYSIAAHHSVTTGFYVMAIAKELNWKKEQIFEATMAAITHDIGKMDVPHQTLACTGTLNDTHWQEIRLHTLIGGKLLHQGSLNTATMVAMNHHEWYAAVAGKGYGCLTTFRDAAREELKLDVNRYLALATQKQLEMIQLCSIADMVSSLEETYVYREALPPVSVLVAMNHDARKGHFNPELFRVWHTLYTRKHPQLLQAGMRFALPREMEKLVVRNQELFVGLDGVVRQLSYDELARLDLLSPLKQKKVDLDGIQKNGKISMDFMKFKGVEVPREQWESLGIMPEKPVRILLPAMEIRLTREDLLLLGVSEQHCAERRVARRLEQAKQGLSLSELAKLGVQIPKDPLAQAGRKIKKRVSYEMIVVEEVCDSRAVFAIVRRGDTLEALEQWNAQGQLDPLRRYLFYTIGFVEIDFSAYISLPEMAHIERGEHWQVATPEP